MAAGAPNSSWHPAFMPDHESPPPQPAANEHPQEPFPDGSPDSLHNGTPLEDEPEPHSLDFTGEESGHGDNWWSKDDADDGGAWLASAQPAPPNPDATESNAMSKDEESPAAPSADQSTKPDSGAKHASSMSFARTVSHEVSFGDDDDGDWSLPRTNTDPFKSMPPSDRTNSFPVVPPIASKTEPDNVPLQSNQAMDVLEEDQKDWDLNGDSEDAYPSQEQASHSHHRQLPSMGGDVEPFEGQASDARYDEGVPLIPGSEHQPQEASTNGLDSGRDLFGQDEAEDDGFFSHINGSTGDTSDMPPLERKSTSQAMGDFNAVSFSRQSTMDTVAEDDAAQVDGMPGGASQMPKTVGGHKRTKTEDLNAKWKEAFGGDDDDFLLDDDEGDGKDIDPTAFLGSDDEGLLDDTDNFDEQDATATLPSSQPPSLPSSSHGPSSSPYPPQNPYQPAAPVQQQTTQPSQPAAMAPQGFYNTPAPVAAAPPAPQSGRPPISGMDQPKAQSFSDKSKGGYSSPYDLPSDLVGSVPRPRKRPSTQQLYSPVSAAQPVPPPPASSGVSAGPPGPPPGPPSSHSRPTSSNASEGPLATHKPPAPPLRSKGSFFEELPVASRPRPASRQSSGLASPQHLPPHVGPPPGPAPPAPPVAAPPVAARVPTPTDPPAAQTGPGVQPHGLVAPEKVSPYAALQSGVTPLPPPSRSASSYSPVPAQPSSGAAAPPAPGNRYSPAPPVSRPSSYSPSRGATTTPPVLPHQPRTSSPLAHFETSSGRPYGELAPAERRSSSSSHEPRLNRMPSLPPTREVDEEEDDRSEAGVPLGIRHSSAESKYSPAPPATRQTPPPPSVQLAPAPVTSPPKRSASNYAPQAPPAGQTGFVPPPRPQTQSPTATRVPQADAPGHVRRPSSAHAPTSNEAAQSAQPPYQFHSRARGQSLTMSMIEPTDGREQDPLQRWRGVPILAWGVGGTVITTFPKSIPRYTMSSPTPTIARTPGEVKVQNIKDIESLPEKLSKFPGPLKGKSKKKEVLAWLTSGIEALEREIPDVSFHSELSPEAKRAIERLLLWKILRVFIENDGLLEGNPNVENSVAEILLPESAASVHDSSSPGHTRFGSSSGPMPSMQPDAVDPEAMDSIRVSLTNGDRESAVWTAVDKRLWGHAMLIAQTVSPTLYQRVAQEFVRNEVNYPGHSNEPIAALYKILSGNYDDCVDELVPSHARAGFQLVSTDLSAGQSNDTVSGLDKWRQTLALVLRNRSPEDERGLSALGNLLAGYGRAEAAHVCFMFSRSVSTFGGSDDPNSSFVLLGSDHKKQPSQLGKEPEALQLSEVYEYGLTLAGGVAAAGGAPHLAGYKLQHALTLAEYGCRDKALQYCDAIAAAMSSQTKRSPYYNGYLASSVDDFMTRLKQAPKGESGSWISKPSMNKVSDSMWNKFNKFVAGDDEDGSGGGAANAENSPFSHVGNTPTLSPSPSVNNFETYGSASRNFTPSAPVSKYAPAVPSPNSGQANPYEPASKYTPAETPADQAPSEHTGYPVPAASASSPEAAPAQANPYAPTSSYQPTGNATAGYQPVSLPQSASTPALSSPQSQPSLGYSPGIPGYEPSHPQMIPQPGFSNNDAATGPETGGFEPPTFQPYGYEPSSYEPPSYEPPSYQPPSYEPDPEPSAEDGETQKPKKSFMDDDEDDIPGLRPQGRSKSDKDRENEEMFRKAAEEDAKRAEEEKAAKKGWGLGTWFSKKPPTPKPNEAAPNKPVRANLGEASSFVYDPDLKRWVNKKPGAETPEPKKATPPPPRAGPRSATGTPPPPMATPPPPGRSVSGGPPPRSMPPPAGPQLRPAPSHPQLRPAPSQENLGVPPPAPMARSQSNTGGTGPPSAPPSRPGTSMSNASSIDDLIGASAPRKPGQKKPRKSGRYVDVMAAK